MKFWLKKVWRKTPAWARILIVLEYVATVLEIITFFVVVVKHT